MLLRILCWPETPQAQVAHGRSKIGTAPVVIPCTRCSPHASPAAKKSQVLLWLADLIPSQI
jgi:hypothetical protein